MHIAERVIEQRARLKRTTSAIIINNVAHEFNVSSATVYRAINTMCIPLHDCANTNETK